VLKADRSQLQQHLLACPQKKRKRHLPLLLSQLKKKRKLLNLPLVLEHLEVK
jgi:hypothetical protein